ncbi:MAG: dihydrolipoyl dehydrogenase [Candidatus Sungbacteria bacterium]|nr:dihydrolipoyl dehydrogenase [bacterium]MDZ4285883.1 dihydrolipoyl dehydrogenase [Candidatus Sungbacteria bacterium]
MIKDLVVIGAGPGGYAAAILAAKKGMAVTLVEKNKPGGTCLQIGCIPSKILLDAAKRWEQLDALRDVLTGTLPLLDPAKLASFTRSRVAEITEGLEHLIKNAGVNLMYGTASFSDEHEITVESDDGQKIIPTKHILIACGTGPRLIQGIPYPSPRVWTNTEALAIPEMPNHLIILGGGAIGCEFASFYRSLDIPVTILEAMPRLLPTEDIEVSREMKNTFEDHGITIVTGEKNLRIDVQDSGVHVFRGDEALCTGSHILVAIGISPKMELLKLENVGVQKDDHGFIRVSTPTYQTNMPHIYAIGDCISFADMPHPSLAHVAAAEAEQVVQHMIGGALHPIDYMNIPFCLFTSPEVAHVGLTETQAKEMSCPYPGHTIRAVRVRYQSLGRAIALGVDQGFIKIVEHTDTFRSKPLRRIAGAHIVGEGASELIHIFAEARNAEDSITHMKRLIFQHPTWAELIGETLRALDGEAVHVLRKKLA